MASINKVLGQSKPGAASLTALYTVPALTQALSSTITVCNQSATATAFRVSVAPAGAADSPSQYIWFDVPISGFDTFAATIGVTLGAGDVVRVYNTLATLSFSLFGVEIT